jgi:hypothetical protein
MAQRWHDLLFAHWPLPVQALRPLLPPALPIDTFDGVAWLGIVPFRMSGVRARWLPPLPGLSAFPELNVRTYATLDDRPGVWFLSLDAASRLAVWTARRLFRLPYVHARMACRRRDGWVRYDSRRPGGVFQGAYRARGAAAPSAPGSLGHFLTERYCLYAADGRGRLYRGEIDHPPWRLAPAELVAEVNTMAEAHGLRLPPAPPLLHLAEDQRVRIWSLQALG